MPDRARHAKVAAKSAALVGLAGTLAGCALPNPPYDGSTETTLIFLEGSRDFTAFVRPRTAPWEDARAAALAKAALHCKRTFGTSTVTLTGAEDGSFAVPYDWIIEGRCG